MKQTYMSDIAYIQKIIFA